MFEGDSLQVLLWLAGLSVAGVMGAITAQVGWRSKSLWGMAGFFGLASVGWLLLPNASPIIQAISPFLVAAVRSNALAAVVIVGVVALMLGRRTDREEAAAQATPLEDERQKRREHQQTVEALDEARQSAVFAMADASPSGRERTAERELPSLKAALLSAEKVHGIPRPPYLENAATTVELHARLIEQILPLLRAGHVDEARAAAHDIVDRLNELAKKA